MSFFRSSIKSLVYTVCRFLIPWRRAHRAMVLAYHSIGYANDEFTVTPEEFDWQLSELRRQGCHLVSLHDLEQMRERKDIAPRTVVLTFDDGRKDNRTYAFPLLRKFNAPCTIFLITGSIGSRLPSSAGDVPMLDATDIRDMLDSGLVDFQPHTVSHPRLTVLTPEQVRSEIERSKQAVEALTGKECRYFAYPFGRTTEEVEKSAASCGISLAFATMPGAVRPESPPFRLPRNGIGANVTRVQFKGIIAHGALS